MNDYKTVSFSALESYKNCPQLFKYKYIDKEPYEKPLEKALLVGSWTHKLIEETLNGTEETINDSFLSNIGSWIHECGIHLDIDERENLIELSTNLSHLLYRASSFCNDQSKIRNSNGTVLRSPIDYPSTSFKSELAKLPSYRYKAQLDQIAAQRNPIFLEMSFSWLFAEALYNASAFSLPKWYSKTIKTELEFGTNEENLVPLVTDECSLLGYIDWIVELNDGRVAIIDHKTSTKCPTNEEVLFHPQLNLYAYAYYVLYGKYPDIIGINHIKSGNIILTAVNKNIVAETVEYYANIYKLSQLDLAIKKHPNDYQSPCVKKDYNSNKVISICPYLEKCWGKYKNILKL